MWLVLLILAALLNVIEPITGALTDVLGTVFDGIGGVVGFIVMVLPFTGG